MILLLIFILLLRSSNSSKVLGTAFVYVNNLQVQDLETEKRDPRTVVSIILGGGAGTRLFPLTKRRAKPAVSCFSNIVKFPVAQSRTNREYV